MITIKNKGSNSLYVETSGLNGVGFVISIDEAKTIMKAKNKESYINNGIPFYVEDEIIRFAFGGSHRIVIDLDKIEFLELLDKEIANA